MDVFDRPPAVAEDTLQYILHPGLAFPGKSAVTALAALIDSHVSSLLPNHIWHKDAFELKVVAAHHRNQEWNIEGHMRVGDCVDDEWCVVWLLRDITRRWDVTASVFDSDGEFLLIEAAEHLPAWITPANSKNRVWIHLGRLHIIPLGYESPPFTKPERHQLAGAGCDDEGGEQQTDADYISVSDAIDLVRDVRINTLAKPGVEQAAFRRTECYPGTLPQHLHRTKVYVPRDIALALSNNPALIQKAAEAFYTRDAPQLRAATRMSRFPPDTIILATVTMTRTAYAQLMGQVFRPPKVFGRWKENEHTLEWRWRDIGMKIACGFEMVYQERHGTAADGADGSELSAEARKEALRRDDAYVRYIQILKKVDFFKGEHEGSALWREQENRAAVSFIHARQPDNANRPSFASLVNSAIMQAQTQQDKGNTWSFVNGDEDSDEWLSVDEGMLNNILSAHLQTSSTPGGGTDIKTERGEHTEILGKQVGEQRSQLLSLAKKVENFVEGTGNLQGATFEDESLSDGTEMSELSDSDDDSVSDSQANIATINITDAEKQAAMATLVPALDPSEYGTMPASFHSNSQKVKEVSLQSQMPPVEKPSEPDANTKPKPMRPLIFLKDQFEGAEDSDDESEDESNGGGYEEDEDDRPQIVGEFEVDMQEEEEDFIRFSRDALGISAEIWDDIVEDRRRRGAFLPPSALQENTKKESHASPPPALSGVPAVSRPQKPDSAVRPNGNPNLDSFEAVMQAMDAELSRVKQDKRVAIAQTTSVVSPSKANCANKGKGRVEDEVEVDASMDAELREAYEDSSDEDQTGETPMDYTLMKNFLESFKSQQGLPGPVGNLVGRLGWQLPRDEN